MELWHCLGLPPTQDASHHQDYYIFSRESQPKPSFVTGILGGGYTEDIVFFLHASNREFSSEKKPIGW